MKTMILPQLELMFGLLATGLYNEKSRKYYSTELVRLNAGQYCKEIAKFFKPHLRHPVYVQLSKMMDFGFFFSRPVELMLAVSEPPELAWRETPSEILLKYSGGMEQLNLLLELMRDFALCTDYMLFFENIKTYYNEDLHLVHSFVQQYPAVETMEGFFGEPQDSYAYIISKLPVGNFGIHFREPGGKLRLNSVFNVTEPKKDPFHIGALSLNTTFHEFSHPVVNPLTEANPLLVERYQKAFGQLQAYKLPGIASGYGDWPDCINEHLVRSLACYLTGKCSGEAERQRWQEKEVARGYRFLPHMLEAFQDYEQKRAQYPTFASYYPTLLQVFEKEIA